MTCTTRDDQPSTWALGDYPAMAERLLEAAAAAVGVAGIRSGHMVLDVGTGTGNAALLAAGAGGVVTGVDPTPQLLALAEDRARQESLAIAWQHGSAEQLPAADHGFDCVLSVFGAMYSADPAAAANELVRCCRPGGRIVLTAWSPNGFMTAANRTLAPYLPPPPPDGVPPARWGDPGFLRHLFPAEDHQVITTRESVRFQFPTPQTAAEFWIRTAGHLQAERADLHSRGAWEQLLADLEHCFAEANTDRTGRVVVESAYLLTVVIPHRQAAPGVSTPIGGESPARPERNRT
jgi:SAM-dependent methyltransferase